MKTANILIVDDNDWNLNYLTDLINSFGHKTLSAKNGTEGIEKIKTDNPDIMLLDILMPKMNGFQVLEQLRNQNISDIPIIIISSLNEMENIVQGIRMGADDYLVKPVQPELLKIRIENSLFKKFKHDEEKQILEKISSSFNYLKKMEQIRSSQVSLIVHDLNNPLSAIKGYSQAITMKEEKDTNIDYLKKICESALEMETSINAILDISKFEINQMELCQDTFDVVSLCRDIFHAFLLKKEESKECRFETDYGEIIIKSDRVLLTKILENLLINADKHSPSGSKIEFQIKKHKDHALITIEDNRYGIPNELLPKIFDKFFKVEVKKTGKKYGFGLGLYFCKLAIEAMGGEIRAESEEEKGAKFFISLKISN